METFCQFSDFWEVNCLQVFSTTVQEVAHSAFTKIIFRDSRHFGLTEEDCAVLQTLSIFCLKSLLRLEGKFLRETLNRAKPVKGWLYSKALSDTWPAFKRLVCFAFCCVWETEKETSHYHVKLSLNYFKC